MSDYLPMEAELGGRSSTDLETITPKEQEVDTTGDIKFQWLPHIDFADLSSFFIPKTNSSEVSKDLFRYALLAAIQIERRITNIRPTSEALKRFADWIHEWTKPNSAQNKNFYGPLDAKDISDLTSLGEDEVTDLLNQLKQSRALESFSPLLALLGLVVENCEGIVSGSLNAIEILQKDNALRLFHAWCVSRSDYKNFFQVLGHTYPRLRILEIGGGYGGTTAAVVGGFTPAGEPLYSSYVYTNSSSVVIASAPKIHKFPGMQYRVLDISRDPSEQGFEENSFDLIIAGEALQKSSNTKRTLTHIRKLLSPKGYLCLQASQGGQPVFNIVFGILPAWWPEERIATRQTTTCVDTSSKDTDQWQQQWNDNLRRTGFTGIDVQVSYNTKPGNLKLNIVSRAASTKPKPAGVILFYNPLDQSQCRVQMETALAQRDINFDVFDIPQTASSNRQSIPSGEKVVCLLGFESLFFKGLSATDWEAFKRTMQSLGTEQIFWILHSVQSLGGVRKLGCELAVGITTLVMQSITPPDWDLAIRVLEYVRERGDSIEQECELAICNGVLKVGRRVSSSMHRHLGGIWS